MIVCAFFVVVFSQNTFRDGYFEVYTEGFHTYAGSWYNGGNISSSFFIKNYLAQPALSLTGLATNICQNITITIQGNFDILFQRLLDPVISLTTNLTITENNLVIYDQLETSVGPKVAFITRSLVPQDYQYCFQNPAATTSILITSVALNLTLYHETSTFTITTDT